MTARVMNAASVEVPALSRSVRRDLGISVALTLVGALGAWPIAVAPEGPRAHSITLLVWLALIAPAIGCACTSARVALLPFGVTIPVAWFALLALVEAFAPRALPSATWAALAIAGLFCLGAAIGRFVERLGLGAGVLALLAVLLVALPGNLGIQWNPSAASRLLDLSPATLVCECAGLDWMRHPSVYAPVGTDRFQREPWSGALAGPLALVVGCAALLIAARVSSSRPGRTR